VRTTGKPPVSRKTVGRLSLYRRVLASLQESGAGNVYSHQLGRVARVSAAQVRRDCMVIGYSGCPNRGYEVESCMAALEDILGGTIPREVALVGVEGLGRLLLSHSSRDLTMVSISVGFDTDKKLIGTTVNGCPVFSLEEIEKVVAEKGIRIAILAVPQELAQTSADALVQAGVLSIVDFSPIPVQVPEEVFSDHVDITAALESAAYFSQGEGAAELSAGKDSDALAGTGTESIIRTTGSLLAGDNMKLEDLARQIGARILTPGPPGGGEVNRIYAGDRVSDLLNEASEKTLPITNLVNLQMLRVAELMEIPGVCFVEGADPDQELIELAKTNRTMIMVSPAGMFETCGLIYQSLSSRSRT
jgi:redox-sensing transcriptional repressor